MTKLGTMERLFGLMIVIKGMTFFEIKSLAELDGLYWDKNKTLYWVFPKRVLNVFSKVYILTYLFEASNMYHWMLLNDIPFEKKTIKKVNEQLLLVDYFKQDVSHFKKLITIIEDENLNSIGKSINCFGHDLLHTVNFVNYKLVQRHIKQLKTQYTMC